MPAPAVIPALIAYVKVVAVKTLVVGIRSSKPLTGRRVRYPLGVRRCIVGGGRRSIGFQVVPHGSQGIPVRPGARLGSPFTMTKPA